MLLPAYLDLWMQTSPAPTVVPDVSLWLHGPKSGPADVQVVWRADLSDEDLDQAFSAKMSDAAKERPTAIVAAVRPSSLEAMSLPMAAARRSLSGGVAADIVDVEGAASDDGKPQTGKLVLRWKGDDSEVIAADALRPGDTIVVPATRGGILYGCFEPGSRAPVPDLAERAALFGRGQPVFRLQANVLTQLGLSLPIEDLQETRGALEVLAEQAEPTSWRKLWLEALARSKSSVVVDTNDPRSVVLGRRIQTQTRRALLHTDDTVEDGVELTTDDDDSFHAGRAVTLSEHSADVERFARDYVDLTRFGGHRMFTEEGVQDVKESDSICAGVPAPNGGISSRWASAVGALEGVWADSLVDSALGETIGA